MKKFSIILSFILAFSMIAAVLSSTVYALNQDDADSFAVSHPTITVKADESATVDIIFYGTEKDTYLTVEGTVSKVASNNPQITLNALTPGYTTDGLNSFVNLDEGSFKYTDPTAITGIEVEANAPIITATYTVPAGTPSGDYYVTVNLKDSMNSTWAQVAEKEYTATITVTEAPAAGDEEGGDDAGDNDATDGYVATLTATTLANQGDPVQVTVNVNKPFNSAKIVLSYDATVLKFNDNGGALADGQTMTYEDPAATFENKEADGKGTITILDFGSAFAQGAAYTLTFTSQKGGNTEVEVESAGFSTAEEAETEDLIPVTSSADANVVVKHKVTFNGNEDFVVPGGTFEGTIPNYVPANNTYVVKVNDVAQENLEIDAAGNFSITNVTEELTITFEATPNQYTLTWEDPNDCVTDKYPAGNTVSYGQEITFKVPAEQLPDGTTDGYRYVVEVTVKVDETTTQTIAPTVLGQTYTISGDKITGDITITVTKETLSATQTTITVESPDATVKYGDETISGAITVTKNGEYELTVVKENNYDYTVMQYNGEDTQGTELEVAEDGTFTVAVTDKPVRIVVTRTLITTGLEVSQYLGVNGKDFWLVKMTGTQINNKTYTLTEDGKTNNFFWSEVYGAYCYLIIRDTGKQANDIKTEIEGAITLTDGTAIEINYEGDVNKSGSKDVNDAQLVWNMYNADYTDFTAAVTVEKFLRADVETNGEINVNDAAEVITIIQAPTAGN